MHDEIEVVEEDPFGSFVAFHVGRPAALGRQCFGDGVGNRADLPRVDAGTDQKEVGEPPGAPQVQQRDIFGLLVLGCGDDGLLYSTIVISRSASGTGLPSRNAIPSG